MWDVLKERFLSYSTIKNKNGGSLMKKIFLFLFAFVLTSTIFSQVRLSTVYNFPTISGSSEDSLLNGLKSIRGVYFDNDIDGDGKAEIVVTNYNDKGHVHVFEVVGNDSIQLVWTSPSLMAGAGGANQTPRYVLVGDLDNDGKKEIIAQVGNQGIYIFEWDGVIGSNNYGTQPSQIINSTTLPELTGLSGNCEFMDIGDIDNDGQNELVVAYNSSPNSNDKYYVISAIGDWSTNDPGFSGFFAEWVGTRTQMQAYKFDAGSPYSMTIAQLDGSGNKEVVLQAWNKKNVTVLRSTSKDNYVLCDTTNGKQNYFLGGTLDDVALFGGIAYDIDNDGREEVYLPTYSASDGTSLPHKGFVHMIYYDPGKNVNEIDSNNVFTLDFSSLYSPDENYWFNNTFGVGYGDVEGNGKRHIYVSSGYPRNILSAEFLGGDKTNPANWHLYVLYQGDNSAEAKTIFIKDSLGIVDTSYGYSKDSAAIASKIFARNTDFDKDGYQDIIIPYQTIPDSFGVYKYVWNSSTSKYDTMFYKVVNPKRWGFRIIEGTRPSGVEAKDIVVITPDDFKLYQNYPNPFNPSTEINFYLPVESKISLKIYNQLGELVKTLISDQNFTRGSYSVRWEGTNDNGDKVSSGLYIAQLRFGNFSKEIKMMLLK